VCGRWACEGVRICGPCSGVGMCGSRATSSCTSAYQDYWHNTSMSVLILLFLSSCYHISSVLIPNLGPQERKRRRRGRRRRHRRRRVGGRRLSSGDTCGAPGATRTYSATGATGTYPPWILLYMCAHTSNIVTEHASRADHPKP
jgi:hypothetical protein